MVDEKLVNNDFFYYFAYGSNLLTERLNVQIKGAVFESIGCLSDYKLCFYDHSSRWHGALASIEQSAGAEVWGCVWRVPNAFADELDLQENLYSRLQVNVKVRDSNFLCRTYQYLKNDRKLLPPSPHYKHVIVSGAKEHKIPAAYIQQLVDIEDNGYVGEIAVHLEALKDLYAKK